MPTIPVNDHFLNLVRQGDCAGCTASSRGARLLAHAVLEHGLTLDAEAAAGLHQWVDYARQFPTTARDYLDLVLT